MEFAAAYARLSIKDQSNNSIPGQIERIESFCTRNKITLTKTFIDNGQSAFNFNRREWKELEIYIKTNKEIKYLVIDTIDRFSRADLVDALHKMNDIQKRLKVKILTITDPLNLDTEDFGVELRRIMELMFSNYELKRIRKRTSDGMYTALASGRWVNRAPFGYINARDPEGKPILQVDEEKAYIVRLIFRMYLNGMEMEEIRKNTSANGMKLQSGSAMRRILSNPLYAGLIKLPKHGHNLARIITGLHPRIISESDYWLAQEKINGKTRVSQRKEEVFLVGIIKCSCGLKMTTDKSRGKTKKEYRYYVCPKCRKAYSVDKLHKQMYEVIDLLSLPEKSIKSIGDKFKSMVDDRINNKAGDLMRAKHNLKKVQDRIDSIQEKYLKQPDISERVYLKTITEMKADEQRLLNQVAQLSNNSRTYYNKMADLLPQLSRLAELFKEWPLYRQQSFIKMVFDNVLSYGNRIYRTQGIHFLFAHNYNIMKEKGLLEIEQSSTNLGVTPERSLNESIIETLEEVFSLIDSNVMTA